jgi:GNAT superfamily N-acetyltransferase
MAITVRILNTKERSDVRKFVDFPFDLYSGCGQWSPTLFSTIKLAMNRKKHPFYKHSDAAFILAEEEGEVLGRIAVLDNHHYNTYNNSRVAFFYYFDAVDDADVAKVLFAKAEAWAAKRGLTSMLGPKGMLRADAYGILIEGYEYVAALGMPYNYDYYPELMTAAGYEKEMDYLSGYLSAETQLPERMFRLVDKVKERSGFWVKSFSSKRELRKWIPAIQRVNNEAFTNVWGYYPIDDAEVQMIGKQLLAIADPHLLKLVMKGDDIAGFAFIFPDITEALQATGGRLWPFGWVRILRAIRTTRRLNGNGIGLLPEYQGFGATALLYTELEKTLRQRDAAWCEIAQAMETNFKSLGDMNAVGVTWHKRHRVYRRVL